ncbi:hypothetical protein PSU4_58710 [Pseudonocardia sulfidoxydans NBRC 16205]|uniref:Uncharacterized protein n=1 Tax=Pseudonocardia sulfidoxydans NBRC 16205 TaxID=1223511 RepID=A0A511DRI3_9PSEU|nr:hypothetical protein [Pseudonocardia sulfidoxydans]GEL26917.1 hypothetical protein PSU4_58710 [Pseudonocardia sulfidoxydans NBRC 16205]
MAEIAARLSQVAMNSITEVDAFISASLSTDEITPKLKNGIDAVRNGLRAVATEGANRKAGICDCPVDHFSELMQDAHESVSGSTPSLGPGRSMAAAMLRIASAVARRAEVDLVAASIVTAASLGFMRAVPGLLTAIADELDAEEWRRIPVEIRTDK